MKGNVKFSSPLESKADQLAVPDDKSICLSLADIGGNKPYWVPLDHLFIDLQQPLRRAGHFIYHLKKHLDEEIVDKLKEDMSEICNKTLNEVHKARNSGSTNIQVC
jgi:hypothetical protein